MNYVLICEWPFPSRTAPGRALHVKRLTRDQVIQQIRPHWSKIDETLALLDGCSDQEGANRRHFGVPIDLLAGRHTLHVEGKMDFEFLRFRLPCPACNTSGKGCRHRIPLEWVDADHICSPRCQIRPYQRTQQTHFALR